MIEESPERSSQILLEHTNLDIILRGSIPSEPEMMQRKYFAALLPRTFHFTSLEQPRGNYAAQLGGILQHYIYVVAHDGTTENDRTLEGSMLHRDTHRIITVSFS